jgi:exosome complex component RRP4
VRTIRESGLGKVSQGHLVKINPTKVPRLIGHKGSMIYVIKRETGCNITVGQNGWVLVSSNRPEMESLAIRAIRIVEKEAHTTGLTDRIAEFLRKEKESIIVSRKN